MRIIIKRGLLLDEYYELVKDTETDRYYHCFRDGVKKYHEVEVSEKVASAIKDFWSVDKKMEHEYERHIEHSELTDITLNKRIMDKPISIEDSVIRKSSFEDLRKAINELPEIQKRRIKKYYFDEKTEEEIAKEENTTQPSVHIILERAKQNLKKILKNKI